MNQIAFYGGMVLVVVVVGSFLWVFRGGSPERNIVRLPGGVEFELNTTAFVVMAFGVVLVVDARGSARFGQQAGHAGGS